MSEQSGIWADDLLDRETDARFLIDFLTRRSNERAQRDLPRSYVLNLDSRWGRGKTFFLTRLQQQLIIEGFLAAYVNAWRDDHADAPLVSVMAAIDGTLKPHLKTKAKAKKLWNGAKANALKIAATAGRGIVKQVAKKYLGNEVKEVAELFENGAKPSATEGSTQAEEATSAVVDAIDAVADKIMSEAIDQFRARDQSIQKFKDNVARCLTSLSKDKPTFLFVLVDELDRCRPPYAIEMLEQIKHLFEIDGVIFIAATDTEQLRHSVGAVYGEQFDSSRYLLRFFDRTYAFEDPDQKAFVKSLFKEHQIDAERLASLPGDDHVSFLVQAAKYFELSLRDMNQCFDYLRTVATLWPYKSPLNLVVLVPLIVSHLRADKSEFERLSNQRPVNVQEELVRRQSTPWPIELPGEYGKLTKHHFVELHESIQRLLTKTLSDIFRDSTSHGAIAEWARHLVGLEVHQDYSGALSKNWSHMRKYPQLVRSAARLEKARYTEVIID